MSCLIFPNQLFELKYYPDDIVSKFKEIHILEEPVFFGFRNQKLNFNKLKLVLHRASMKYYYDYLTSNKEFKNIKVHYHSFDTLIENPDQDKKYKPKYSSIIGIIKKSGLEKEIYTFDLTDHYLESIINKAFPSIKYLNNPNFAVTKDQLNSYYNKNKSKKTIVQGHFYNWVKEQIGVLTETKSYDTENRNPLPDGVKIPKLGKNTKDDQKYIKEAIEYVSTHPIFKNNCGPQELTLDNCWFPVTHNGSMIWLEKFIKDRLNKFGDYQDAIRDDNQTMFHSLIAPMFNVGLLNPHDIIEDVMKSKAKINNVEGFIRQILGWREYQRYCYLFYYEKMTKSNIFENNQKLDSKLYEGKTGLPPVDDAIKSAFQTGYLHHIQRLMVISNIFNLMNISPDESYKWFMEFSLDSYDWLMTQNVYSMGMWADGGLTMRKPYISTAAYVIKMSNYKAPTKKELKDMETDWTEVWRGLFYRKIIQHRKIFEKTPYIFQIKTWDKMGEKDKTVLLDIANKIINN